MSVSQKFQNIFLEKLNAYEMLNREIGFQLTFRCEIILTFSRKFKHTPLQLISKKKNSAWVKMEDKKYAVYLI